MNYYLIISVLSALLNILLVAAQLQSTQPRFDAQARLTKSWKSDPSSPSHFVDVPSYIIVITASTFDAKSESQVPLSNSELLIRPSSTASFLIDDLSGLIVEKKYTHEQTFKLTTNSLGRVSFSIVSPLTSIKAPGLYIRSNQMEKEKWVLMYPDVDVINQLKNLDDSVFKELNPNLSPETVKSTNELVKRVMNLAIWSDLNIEKERKVKRLVKRTLPPSTASRMMKKGDIDADKEFHYERETSAVMTWIVEDTPDNIRRELPKPKSYWVYSLSSTNSTSTSSSNSSGFNSPAAVFTPNPPRRMLRRLNKRDDDEEDNDDDDKDDDDKLPRIPSVFDPSKDEVKSISTVPERPKGFIAIIKNSIGKLFEMVVETVKDAVEILKGVFKKVGIELKELKKKIMAKFNFEAISRSQKFLSHYFRTLMPISKKAAESKKEQWVTYMNNATQNAFDSIDHLASKINGQPSIDKFKNGASSKQSSKDPTKRPDLGSTSIMGKFVEDRLIGHLPNAAISSSTSDSANKTTSNAIQALADLSKDFTTSLSSISFPSSLTSLSNSSTLLTGNIFQQTFSSLLLQSKKLLHGMNNFVSSIVVKMIQYIDMMLKLFDNLLEIKLEIPFFSKWWKGVVQNDTKKDNARAKEDGDGMTVLDLFTWFGAGVFTWDYMAWKSSEPFTSTDMSVLLNSQNPFFFAEDYTRNTLTGVPSEKKRYKFRCKFDWALQATKLSMSLIKVAVALAMEFGSSTHKAALGVLVSVNSFISAGTTYPLTHMTGELSEKTLNKAVDNILPQFWIWWAYAFVPITLYQTRFLNEMVIGRDKIGYFNLAILGVPETVFIILAIKHVVPQINWSDPKRVVGVSFSFASWFLSFVHTFLIASPDPATKMIATTADKLKLLANFGRLQVFMATDLLSLTSSGI